MVDCIGGRAKSKNSDVCEVDKAFDKPEKSPISNGVFVSGDHILNSSLEANMNTKRDDVDDLEKSHGEIVEILSEKSKSISKKKSLRRVFLFQPKFNNSKNVSENFREDDKGNKSTTRGKLKVSTRGGEF